MSPFAKFVAIAAVIGILVVLITPVSDELPCTARHGAPLTLALPLTVISNVAQPIFPNLRPNFAAVQLFSGPDLLYFTCTLLC